MPSKTIIVTGAEGNLGQAVTKKFLDKDYNVIGTIHKKRNDNFTDQNFHQEALDLLNEENAQNFVTGVIEKYKAIDVAVLTAGGFASGNIMTLKT
ncbi:MAG TPA: SDR family NAD(P)-dependent oxidoreductase, partial [Hanamia sp.]